MSTYTEFFLKSSSSIYQIECIEISHSMFTQTYYIVRNVPTGVTVVHEDTTSHTYVYYPLRLNMGSDLANLDQSITIELGDLGEIIPTEIDRIRDSNTFDERPVVKYRIYSSGDLTSPIYGPVTYEIQNVTFNKTGCTLEARPPTVNINKTGEIYKLDRFPMLKGFL